MVWTRVQCKNNSGTNSASLAVTVTSSTGGSLLVAGLILNTSNPTPTTPTNFTSRVTVNNATGPVWIRLYDWINSTAGQTTVTFSSLPTGLAKIQVAFVAEYTGEATTGTTFDQNSSTTGSSQTQILSGTTAALSASNELAVVVGGNFDSGGNETAPSGPTNSFTIPANGTKSGSNSSAQLLWGVLCDLFPISGTAAQSTTVTVNGALSALQYSGVISTYEIAAAARGLFRPSPTTGVGTGGSFFADPVQCVRPIRRRFAMAESGLWLPDKRVALAA